MRAALEALCEQMCLGDQISFAGARDDVLSYYKQAQVFCAALLFLRTAIDVA